MILRLPTALAGPVLLALASATAAAQPVDAGPDADPDADPVDDPAATDAGPPPGLPAVSKPPEEGRRLAPQERWQDWELRGELVDPPEVVRQFFDVRMRQAARSLEDPLEELGEFARALGYEIVSLTTRSGARGATGILQLRPLLTVFTISVDVDNLGGRIRDWLPQFFEMIFEEQILRRMQLRAGDSLPRDPAESRIVLAEEEQRIEDFMRNEGFFDARALATTKPRGKHSVEIEVEVFKGRRYTVGTITVKGNASIPAPEITSKFHHAAVCPFFFCVGTARFRRDDLARDIQRVVELYQERGYPGARVRTDFEPRHSFKRKSHTVEFTVYVSERRKIDVVFEGNDKRGTPDDQLEKVLTFNEEGSYDDVEVEASAQAIRSFYQARGKFEAQVAWERERFGGVFERIIFTIDEGPRLPVVSVKFEGNENLSDSYLYSQVQTRVFRRVAVLGGGGGYATRVQLDQDRVRIARLYQERGYYQVSIEADVTRSQRTQGNAGALAAAVAAGLPAAGLYVTFYIKEGKQRVVEDVRFEFQRPADKSRDPGDAYYERRRRQLSGEIGLKKGDPYTDARTNEDNAKIGRFYFGQGHPYAAIETDTEEAGSPERLVVIHDVTEGPTVTLGKVMVRGNFRTDDWVVHDELGFDEGDTLTLERADRAQQSLRSAGLFRTVNVKYVDFDQKRLSRVNVLVEVQERDRLGYEFAAGYSTQVDGFLEGTFFHHNLLGDGIRGDVHVLGAQKQQSIDLRIGLPRWIGRRMTFDAIALTTELGGFFKSEDTERFGTLLTAGGNITLSKRWDRGSLNGVSLGVRYDVRRASRDEELVRPAGASEDLETGKVATTTGSIGPVLTIDKRRDATGRLNPLAPQAGWYTQFSAAYADSFLSAPIEILPDFSRGRDRFLKLGGVGQTLVKPSKRTLLTLGGQYDHGVPLGDEFLLPEVERFFAGGDTKMRGFEKDHLATEVIVDPLPPIDGVSRIRVVPAGGNIRALATLDFQVEVWDLWGFPMASAIFFDNGIVINSWVGTKLNDLRHSIGIALARLVTPFGSFSLEYAIPLDPKLGDNARGRLHFNIGLQY